MRHTIAVVAFAAVVASGAGSLVVLPTGATRAAGKDATFLIPAADGYGVADCLTASGTVAAVHAAVEAHLGGSRHGADDLAVLALRC